MSTVARATVYRNTDAHVDVKASRRAWMAEVRVWRGARWPDLAGVWRARMRWWVPWFSLERQALRALRYADRFSDTGLSDGEMRQKVQAAVRWLHAELAD